jgi:Domain of unknown function (DUF4214)
MSGSIGNFFNDLGDSLGGAADDVGREVNDVIDDVRGTNSGAPSTTSREAQVTRLYDSVFDRPPDNAGLEFWTTALRTGVADLDDLAALFVRSPEFQDRYGNTSNAEFVTLLYRNTLNREPDAAGQAFWTGALASNQADRDDVVLAFSESPEHVAIVGPVNDNPLF